MTVAEKEHLSESPMGRHFLDTGHRVSESIYQPWHCHECDAHGDTPHAVALLDALTSGDPESAHSEADDILLLCVSTEIREAWRRAAKRVGFWYA